MPNRISAYAPHLGFVAPAHARPQLWRTVLGLVLIFAIYWFSLLALFTAVETTQGLWAASLFADAMLSGSSPPGMIALLYSFLPAVIGVFAATRLVLGRGAGTLFGPARDTIRNFARVALPLIALWIVMLPITTSDDNVGRHLTLAQLLYWLPFALPGLLLQTSSEELVFRGYLQQQLAVRFRSPLIWMILPSLLFGSMHFSSQEFGQNAFYIVAWTTMFGILAADLTARTGNLGAAIGLHFANNFSALFLVGLYGNLDGLALYNVVINTRDTGAVLPYLMIDAVGMLVAWLFARVMLRV